MKRPQAWKMVVWIGMVALLACATIAMPRAQTSVLTELKAQFNRDKGIPRLIVLMSPT